jgi:hypothetical protein
VGERGETRIMEPLLREILSSEPDIAAWLEPDESDGEDEEAPRP